MDKEINIGRLIRKINQIRRFNQFYTASETIEKIEIINIPNDHIKDFLHLLSDLENEVIKIKGEIK